MKYQIISSAFLYKTDLFNSGCYKCDAMTQWGNDTLYLSPFIWSTRHATTRRHDDTFEKGIMHVAALGSPGLVGSTVWNSPAVFSTVTNETGFGWFWRLKTNECPLNMGVVECNRKKCVCRCSNLVFFVTVRRIFIKLAVHASDPPTIPGRH